MVSTQTTLTCSRSDNLLPHSLLYNIITSKLTEAFELTNFHATFCDYNDNLGHIKKESSQVSFKFTSNFPKSPHFDLTIPTDPLLGSLQDNFSPCRYTPQKRQRLNSAVSPGLAVRDTLGLRTPSKYSCSNCHSVYQSGSALASHVKRCEDMVYKTPLTHAACKELRFNIPEQTLFDNDIPSSKFQEKEQLMHSIAEIQPKSEICEELASIDVSQKQPVCNIRFTPESDGSNDGVMVAYITNEKYVPKSFAENKKVKSGLNKAKHAPTRQSKRKKTKSNKQVVNKILLERIKNSKTKTRAKRTFSKDNISSSKTRKKSVSSDKSNSGNGTKRLKMDTTYLKYEENTVKEKMSSKIASKATDNKKDHLEKDHPANSSKLNKKFVETNKFNNTIDKHSQVEGSKNKKQKGESDVHEAIEEDLDKDTTNFIEKCAFNDKVSILTEGKPTSAGNSKNEHFKGGENQVEEIKIIYDIDLENLVPNSKPEDTINVSTKAEVTSEELTSNIESAKFFCDNCSCKFQSLWSSRRHNYTVHGIGTPLTSEDLLSRQTGTECGICKEHSSPQPSSPAAGVPMWVCGVCGDSLKERTLLIDHKKIHDTLLPPQPQPSGLYKCKICTAVHPTYVTLLKHIDKKHNPSLTCHVCYQMFPSALQLKSHSCGSDVHVACKHCPRKFNSSSEHSKHMNTAHASLALKLNQSACKLCDYTFSSLSKYKLHQTISHPSHDSMCLLCNTAQESRDALIDHVMSVHHAIPFLCTVCEKGFNTQDELTLHKTQHFQ